MTETVAQPGVRKQEESETLALEARDLVCGYEHTTIVRGVSLALPRGAAVAVLGVNGAGKSTFLKALAGVLKPSAGTVHLGGQDVTKLAAHQRAGRGLCLIPEGRAIFRALTVRQNLQMQARKGEEAAALDRAAEVFPILGERLSQAAGTLSGGQQQMLAMARAYVRNPDVVLVDEASLGLAPIIVDEIFEFLTGITARGASLLVVDQFVNRVLDVASHVYVMRRGQIVFAGTPAEARDSDVFRTYLGSEAPDP